MTDEQSNSRGFAGPALFYGLLLLFFFQLCSDFIETIYAIGLMNVEIPPELVSVVLFFSPVVLLFFRRGFSARVNLALMGLVAGLRILELVVSGGAKMIVSGLGVGAFLLLLPAWLARRAAEQDTDSTDELSAGLALALAFSVFLRALGSGSDPLPAQSGAGWLNVILPLYFLAMLFYTFRQTGNEPETATEQTPRARSGFGGTAAFSLGLLSVLAVQYFALVSPTVLARWTEADYRLVLLFLGSALGVFAALLPTGYFERLPNALLLGWNALFLACGVAAILVSGTPFPADTAAYPVDQPAAPLSAQFALYAMLLLSPVLLVNFTRLARRLVLANSSPAALAGGFMVGSLFFLVIVLAQAFTTVYDYIPVVGPFWRDRFWLVFLLAGLGAALPLLGAARQKTLPRVSSSLKAKMDGEAPGVQPPHRAFNPLSGASLPLLVGALIIAIVWAVWTAPRPPQPVPSARLRVLTYNIQQGYDVNVRRAYADQLAAIRALDADIIGLQESDTARFSGGNGDVVRTLAEGLEMYSYYGARTVTGTFGIALLSRYPIENPRTFFMYSTGEQTAALQAEINFEGTRYHILVTHLGNGGPLIQQQQVLQKLADAHNVIAMGDFNFRPTTEQYALTTQTLQDAWVLGGETTTEGLDPLRRIDHVFLSPGINVHAARYISSPVSDHPALLVEITP